MNCKGPCLPHCYNKYSIFAFVIGLAIGSGSVYLYIQHKRNGNIYAVKGYGYWQGANYRTLQPRGSKRTIQIKETAIQREMIKYKPGFFEKIKLFFEFI